MLFVKVEIDHVYRRFNKEADALATAAILNGPSSTGSYFFAGIEPVPTIFTSSTDSVSLALSSLVLKVKRLALAVDKFMRRETEREIVFAKERK